MDDAAPYRIDDDPVTGVLRATVRGFWSIATVDAYARDLDAAIGAIRRQRRRLVLIVDAATMRTQAADVGAYFVDRWRAIVGTPEDRVAIVVESALAAMQFRRIYETDRCRVFSADAEARAWLASEVAGGIS